MILFFSKRLAHRLFWGLMLCVCVLFVCTPPLHAQNPAGYEQAKQAFASLQNDAKRRVWRESWVGLAERFWAIYQKNPQWRNRPAALYRSAQALEGLATYSNSAADARSAVERYRLLWEKYPASPLADDALLRAADICIEKLNKEKEGLALLERVCVRYAKSDSANSASRMLQKYTSTPSRQEEKKDSPGDRRKRSPRQAPQTDTSVPRCPTPRAVSVGTVLIDPGHGGRDPGTRHNGVTEREVTLDLAMRIGELLRDRGVKVAYTRTSNRTVSLDSRSEMIRTTRADIFISIHVNANPSPSISGFETYYLDFARTSAATRLAAIENALKHRSKTSRKALPPDKLFRIQQKESSRLARCVQNTVIGYLEGKKYPDSNGGIKTAPFQVLRRAGVPSVLLEVGYCTNKEEAARLATSAYRALLAKGIADGIMAYAGDR